MNDWLAVFVVTAAINPFAGAAALSGRVVAPRALPVAAAGALLAYIGLAAFARDILDGLSVEPETFDVAAGVILAATGASVLILGPHQYPPPRAWWHTALTPLAVPLLINPAGAAAVVVVATRESVGLAVAAAAAGVLATLLLVAVRLGRAGALSDGASRLIAAVVVTVAAGFAVDGIRSI